MTEIRLSKNELDSMLKNAEQDGRITSIESKQGEQSKMLGDIFAEIRAIKTELSSGYATIKHVDESIEKAVQGERMLFKMAAWGMGIVFIVIMPIVSYLIMNKLSAIDDYMGKNLQFQIKIERHVSDGHKHDIR